METFDVFDVCVFVFTGLTTGMAIGLAIRNKKTKNLQDEIDASDNSYMSLLDKYMDVSSSYRNLMTANARLKITKKKVGRPKGSTNKPKTNGKSTTRKYTRKSSK